MIVAAGTAVLIGSGTALVATIAAFTLAIRARLLRRAQVAAQAENLALQTELDRLRKSQTFSGVGTWDWLVDTDTLHWSDEIYPMFGFAPGEVVPTYSLFCSMVHPDDARRVREGEIACTAGTRLYDQRYRVVWRDGTVRWLSETGDIIVDDDGLPVRMIGTVRDVTEEKAREQRMQHLAFHDELTGLHNRAYFNIRMEDALARARRQSGLMALAFIDLDRFKPINDLHGHAAGDAVLVALAQRLQQTVRATDCVARLGGDEFVVVLEHLSTPDEATALASKLLNAVRAPFALDGLTLNLDASVGIALYPVHADNAVSLIEQADRAMYAAKAAGAGFVVAAPEATPVA